MPERPLWTRSHLIAWCPICPGELHSRAERPTTVDRARIVRWARRHAAEAGHAVHLEEGRIAIIDPPVPESNPEGER